MAALSPSAHVKTNASTPDLGGIPQSTNTPNPSTDVAFATTESTFPSASLFTFLPELYLVLSRLRELRNKPEEVNTSADGLTQVISHDSHGTISLTRSDLQNTPLETRELPGQIYAIKKGIKDAQELVRGLPDITRSVEQQDAELRELRVSVAGLKGRLRELGNIARSDEGQDIVMQGTSD